MSVNIRVSAYASSVWGWRRKYFKKIREGSSAHDLIQALGFNPFKGLRCSVCFFLCKHGVGYYV
jgi:hypothetical protein